MAANQLFVRSLFGVSTVALMQHIMLDVYNSKLWGCRFADLAYDHVHPQIEQGGVTCIIHICLHTSPAE